MPLQGPSRRAVRRSPTAPRRQVVVGKCGRERALPFGNRTGKALDQYLRARARHPHAKLKWFWIGRKGRVTASGIAQLLRRRGREAGIEHLHAHLFRHTFAHLSLRQGSGETDLMRLAGWKSPPRGAPPSVSRRPAVRRQTAS